MDALEYERELAAKDAEILRLRAENHGLRAELMKARFLDHPDIPDDVKQEFLARQEQHVKELEKSYDELRKKTES